MKGFGIPCQWMISVNSCNHNIPKKKQHSYGGSMLIEAGTSRSKVTKNL